MPEVGVCVGGGGDGGVARFVNTCEALVLRMFGGVILAGSVVAQFVEREVAGA